MKKKFLLVILFFLNGHLFAQWTNSKVYFNPLLGLIANSMAKTYDNGLMVCGQYNYRSALIRIDSTGSVVWAKRIGFGINEAFTSITRTNDSCYLMTGTIYQSGVNSIVLSKWDANGSLIFHKVIDDQNSASSAVIKPTFDGGYILCGMAYVSGQQNSGAFIAKLDQNINLEWYKSFYSGNLFDACNSVIQTPDSGYAFVGHLEQPLSDGFLCKLSKNGDVEWTNSYQTTPMNFVSGNDLIALPDGLISYMSTDNEHILVKTDYNGNDIWKKSVSFLTNTQICTGCVTPKMKLLSNGNFILTTGFPSSHLSPSSITCFDTSGTPLFSQILENSAIDILEADGSRFFILGNGPLASMNDSGQVSQRVGILKTDSLGNAVSCTTPSANPVNTSVNILKSVYALTAIDKNFFTPTVVPFVTDHTFQELNGCVGFGNGTNDESPNELKIYPNPSSNVFEISTGNIFQGSLNIQVFDVTGRLMLNKEIIPNHSALIIEHSLCSGLYNIVATNNKSRYIGKLIVK